MSIGSLLFPPFTCIYTEFQQMLVFCSCNCRSIYRHFQAYLKFTRLKFNFQYTQKCMSKLLDFILFDLIRLSHEALHMHIWNGLNFGRIPMYNVRWFRMVSTFQREKKTHLSTQWFECSLRIDPNLRTKL